jgi:hypothetical protein
MRIASLTAALVAVPLLVPQTAYACSKGSLRAPLGDRIVYFTGKATADTLQAGPGSRDYRLSRDRPPSCDAACSRRGSNRGGTTQRAR